MPDEITKTERNPPYKFYLTHLYAQEMSIYGDMGNIIALKYRLQKLGFEVVYQPTTVGQNLPDNTDFYFMGGGQDKEQEIIFKDLLNHKQRLIYDLQNGVAMLAICGAYQLFGQKFVTGDGLEIGGLSWFEVETKAPDKSVKSRCIGNIVESCLIPELSQLKLVGFENHGGQTYFVEESNVEPNCQPLGSVISGFGNNSVQKIEGCVRKNTIGTYLHGSCLPKNPDLTDYLIQKALETKFKNQSLDLNWDNLKNQDQIANLLRENLISRFGK